MDGKIRISTLDGIIGVWPFASNGVILTESKHDEVE
jgi:hypothetical protein